MTPLKDQILRELEKLHEQMERSEGHALNYDYDGVKSLFESALDQILDAAEGCVPEILEGSFPTGSPANGWNSCIKETLSKLKALRGEINNVTD